ncbi:tautomerase PptA [Buttiauxella warmboldiae]|uniref:Tautomerase PptA n=1 Tax=Buttiauxella warmboldiae TaxID=82993 RepID=A0A3N5D7A4_9ENTR|nr:tautomerase PptA [Buttiauxella warmboldiae]RPH22515.1 tautomerase PptA [Buttiauxella warmboldiae]
MPHITVKHYPRELTDEQKQALASDICAVLRKHFNSSDESLSVALTPVEKERWKEDVYDKEISPQLATLAKKPGYSL